MVYEVCHKENQQKLDSNLAWEVVQEMERKGDDMTFLVSIYTIMPEGRSYIFWLYNPDNFFRCLGGFFGAEGGQVMDTRNYNIVPEVEVPKAPEGNFFKKIPDSIVPMLQGMNRKHRRDWYKKNKKLLGDKP